MPSDPTRASDGARARVFGGAPLEPPFGRVMLAKTTHMGDLIISLPMAAALKRRDPDCAVVVLAASANVELARCCPDVDEVVMTPADIASLPALLASLRLDVFIQVNQWDVLAAAAQRAAIPVRIGSLFRWLNIWRCTHLVAIARGVRGLNKRELDLQYLAPFGIAVPDAATIVRDGRLAAPPPVPGLAKTHEVGQAAMFRRMARGRRAIVLCPGAVTASRHRWPSDHYASLIEQCDRRAVHWFICGLASEREPLQDLLRRQIGVPNVTDIVGRLPLAEYIRFVASCDGLIGGSSGPVHLAAALGIPTLALYQSRLHDIARWRPLGEHVTVLHSGVACTGERPWKFFRPGRARALAGASGNVSANLRTSGAVSIADAAAALRASRRTNEHCPCVVAIDPASVAAHVRHWCEVAARERPPQRLEKHHAGSGPPTVESELGAQRSGTNVHAITSATPRARNRD